MIDLATFAAAFCLGTLALHLASIALVLGRDRALARRPAAARQPPVSVLRPVCGLENHAEETLRSGFALRYPDYELVFCVAAGNDPVAALVERLMIEHPAVPARLLVGDERISANPKLNNLVKGWEAARHPLIVMADSNVLLPPDYLQQLVARGGGDTGLVCAPPVAVRPDGPWSELECAFINTYQARWQLAADALGLGFAHGKSMLWRRTDLEAAGGLAALGREAAEDAAATKVVRGSGKRVRLVRRPFGQPLGRRSLAEVWARQLRWARLRRSTFPLFFVPELLAGGLFPAAVAGALTAAGTLPPLGFAAGIVAWYGAEAVLARALGWPQSWRAAGLAVLRDAALPALWVAAWLGDSFEWRGHMMTAAGGDNRAATAGAD